MSGYTDQVRFQQLEQRVSDLEKENSNRKSEILKVIELLEKQQKNIDGLLEIINKNIPSFENFSKH